MQMDESLKKAILQGNQSLWDPANPKKALKKGWYEVWYIIVDDMEREEAYWIRYTMMCPQNRGLSKQDLAGKLDSIGGDAMLWFGFFSVKNPGGNFMVKKKFPLSAMSATRGEMVTTIGDASLTLAGATGGFTTTSGKTVAWDLEFSHFMEPYTPVPKIAYTVGINNTLVTATHPNLRISGTITVNGQVKALQKVPGIQYHTYGDGYKVPWEWFSAHTFQDHPDAFLDFGSKKALRKGILGFFDGTTGHFLWNSILKKVRLMRKIKFTKSLTSLTFSAKYKGKEIAGKLEVPKEALLGVEYTGPQGNSFYCYNSEVASSEMTFQTTNRDGSKTETQYSAQNSVSFETVHDAPQEDIPYLPWDKDEI